MVCYIFETANKSFVQFSALNRSITLESDTRSVVPIESRGTERQGALRSSQRRQHRETRMYDAGTALWDALLALPQFDCDRVPCYLHVHLYRVCIVSVSCLHQYLCRVCTCTRVYVCNCSVYLPVCLSVSVSVSDCICVYICICLCICVWIWICIGTLVSRTAAIKRCIMQ